MSSIDDLPIDPARDASAPPFTHDSSRPSWAPLALIVLAIAIVGGVGWYVWQRDRAAAPASVATPAAPAPDTQAAAAPRVVLPPLDQMDAFLRTLLSGLSSHPQLAAWLATDDLLGNAATAIDRLAQGQTPARDLAPLRPTAAFAVTTRRGVTYIDPASFARYDGIADAVASVEPGKLATAYLTIEPRLAEAWARQGHTGDLRQAVERALATIASTPTPPAEMQLVKKVSGFGFADPELEGLPAAQKQLLRMGPGNLAKVRQAATGFAAALAASR